MACDLVIAWTYLSGKARDILACDLVIAWTYLSGKARDIFIREMALDEDTWLRAWVLWKATFELCQMADKNSPEAEGRNEVLRM